jgi:hypothetical protein
MRKGVFILGAVLMAPLLRAGVHVAVRPDGTKLIFNDGSGGPRRTVEMSDSWLAARIGRPCAFDELIRRAADSHGLDPRLLKSVMMVESGFNPRAVSRKGAMGLMQLMPATARAYGVRDVFDPNENVSGAARYLTYLLNQYDGDLEQALAAYNAGETAVERYQGIPPYDETVLYVHKTLTAYYGRPYLGGGFGRTFTTRFRRMRTGQPVRIERDGHNNVLLTTEPSPAASGRR